MCLGSSLPCVCFPGCINEVSRMPSNTRFCVEGWLLFFPPVPTLPKAIPLPFNPSLSLRRIFLVNTKVIQSLEASEPSLFSITYMLCVYMCGHMHAPTHQTQRACHGLHLDVKGQASAVCSLLPLCGSQGSNPGCQSNACTHLVICFSNWRQSGHCGVFPSTAPWDT